MAKLDFPSSPTDGQVYAAPNGVDYTWNATVGAWTARKVAGLTLVSAGSISGTPVVGGLLAYAQGEASGGTPPYTYSWTWRLSSDDSILQVNGATLTVPARALGDTIYVTLTATDAATDTVTGNTSAYPTSGTITSSTFPNLVLSPISGPNASPSTVSLPSENLYGEVNGTWEDGFTSIYATGNIQFSVNGGAYGASSQSISNGDTLSIIWDPAAIVAASDNVVLEGILTNGTYENSFSITIDRSPLGLTFPDLVDQATSVAISSGITTPTGYNVPVSVSFAGSATSLTSIGLSVAGGPFGSSPQTVNPGQSLQLRGTTGGSNSTAYGVDIAMGSSPTATDTWSVTTASVTPTIAEPSITSPANGSTDINPAVNSPAGIQLVGSDYDPLNGAGDPQTSSEWEVYKDGYPLLSTNSITAVNTQAGGFNDPGSIGGGASNLNGRTVIGYGNGRWVAGGESTTWTTTTSAVPQGWSTPENVPSWTVQITGINYNQNRWVMVGWNGYFTSSLTGTSGSWSTAAQMGGGWSTDTHPYALAYGDGRWVTVGGKGNFSTSTNGTSWTPGAQMSPSWNTSSALAVAYGNGMWVAAGESKFSTSTNGTSWTSPTSVGFTVTAVAYGGGRWVMVGSTPGAVSVVQFITSTDGINWSSPADLPGWSNSGSVYGLVYANGYWLATGVIYYSYSFDGLTWSSRETIERWAAFNLISQFGYYLNDLYIITGQTAVDPHPSRISYTNNPIGFTDLTIAGCQTEGFLAGDTIVSNPAAAGPSVIQSLDDTQVVVTPQDTNWAIGQRIERDPASYTAVTGSPFNVTASPFTTIDIAQSAFSTSSSYYARVQYATTNATAATSEWSAWSEFGTASEFVIPPGTPMGGGYFGGQIEDGGTIYNLIVAPRIGDNTGPNPAGTLYGQSGRVNGTNLTIGRLDWRVTLQEDTPVAVMNNQYYGAGATAALVSSVNHPVFNQFINAANGPNAGAFDLATGGSGGGTGIGGYNDWYLPAMFELEVLYYFLKPDGTLNNTGSGANPYAVAPEPISTNYTSSNPGQTSSSLFQTGGAEAFSGGAEVYWSSTQNSALTTQAWRQGFSDGAMSPTSKTASVSARAIRRIPA